MAVNLLATRSWVLDLLDNSSVSKDILTHEFNRFKIYRNAYNEFILDYNYDYNNIPLMNNKIIQIVTENLPESFDDSRINDFGDLSVGEKNNILTGDIEVLNDYYDPTFLITKLNDPICNITIKTDLQELSDGEATWFGGDNYIKILVTSRLLLGNDGYTYKVVDNIIYRLEDNEWKVYNTDFVYNSAQLATWLNNNIECKMNEDDEFEYKFVIKIESICYNFSNHYLLSEKIRNKVLKEDNVKLNIIYKDKELLSLDDAPEEFDYIYQIENFKLKIRFKTFQTIQEHILVIKEIYTKINDEGTTVKPLILGVNLEASRPPSYTNISEGNQQTLHQYVLIDKPLKYINFVDDNGDPDEREIVGDYCKFGNLEPCLLEIISNYERIYVKKHSFY